MKLLKPNSDSKSKKQPNELIAPLLLKAISLFPHLSHLFYLYDKIIEFTDSVAYYCEELGKMVDVNGRPAYSLFSGAFFLLVRFIDKLGIKDGSYNQKVFIDILKSYPLTYEWYSRYCHSFFCKNIPTSFT